MRQIANADKLQDILLRALGTYTAQTPELFLLRIENASGVSVSELKETNIDAFIAALDDELQALTEAWKARFVSSVIRKLIDKSLI